MKLIANILWLIFGGIATAFIWAVAGILLCITIIGIPLGVQCFKAAALSFAPFGRRVVWNFSKHPIANTVWAILCGWEMAFIYLFVGVWNCITIIGIPYGLQAFKMMKLALFPFGAKIK